MAKGRYGLAGNGGVRSRSWKENVPSSRRSVDHAGRPIGAPALLDPQRRTVDYLRLAVTDRCNLRCRYCMPAEGIAHSARAELLSFEELSRICGLLVGLGVRKIRITGGEPLLRRGLVDWLSRIAALPDVPELLITTNGTLLRENLDGLVRAGVRRINLSLDSLRPSTWATIARRGALSTVLDSIDLVLERGLGLKINVVVLPGLNDGELLDFAELTRERSITVRFIEPMPFSGGIEERFVPMSGARIRARIESRHHLLPLPNDPSAVDRLYAIEGYRGRVGIIEGFSRTFCGRCSRLRIDPRGQLRTCLYGGPAADLREILRAGGTDEELRNLILRAVARRFVDGHAAAAANQGQFRSMARIGG
jgi:cyclic pyranopterin phosphate synthase